MGEVVVARQQAAAANLLDGRVLVVGGALGNDSGQEVLSSAEVYTPTAEGLITSQSGLTFQFAQGSSSVSSQTVQVLSNTLDQRSKQVRSAAKELGVAIVGSEVSGDHVAMTKAAVERSGRLIDELRSQDGTSPKLAELKTVNDELESGIIVIDTLSQEMSNRMQHAANRVNELNEVAAALTQLVTGEAG